MSLSDADVRVLRSWYCRQYPARPIHTLGRLRAMTTHWRREYVGQPPSEYTDQLQDAIDRLHPSDRQNFQPV